VLGALPSPRSMGMAASHIYAQLGLGRSQTQGQWSSKLPNTCPKRFGAQLSGFDSSLKPCLIRLGAQPSPSALGLTTVSA